jgi:hypothetical protein
LKEVTESLNNFGVTFSLNYYRSPARQLTAHRKGSYHPCRRSLFDVRKPAACHESKTKAEKYRAGGGGLSVLRTDLLLPSPVSHEGLACCFGNACPANSRSQVGDERSMSWKERGCFERSAGKAKTSRPRRADPPNWTGIAVFSRAWLGSSLDLGFSPRSAGKLFISLIALKRRRSFPLGLLPDIGRSGRTAAAPTRPCAQEDYWLRGAPNSPDRWCSPLPNLF